MLSNVEIVDEVVPEIAVCSTLVIVDTNVHQFTTMGFYLLRVRDNDLLVRIRQSIDGQFKVSMDDSLCEERESLDDVSIIGRAVYAWKGSRL